MSHRFFNKYVAIFIGAQFIAVPIIWIADVVVSPSGDTIFKLIFYFYLPTIFVVSVGLGLTGESGMIAGVIYGIVLGIFLYGFIFGVVMHYVKRRRVHDHNSI